MDGSAKSAKSETDFTMTRLVEHTALLHSTCLVQPLLSTFWYWSSSPFTLPRCSDRLRLSMEDPTPPFDTPWRFLGPGLNTRSSLKAHQSNWSPLGVEGKNTHQYGGIRTGQHEQIWPPRSLTCFCRTVGSASLEYNFLSVTQLPKRPLLKMDQNGETKRSKGRLWATEEMISPKNLKSRKGSEELQFRRGLSERKPSRPTSHHCHSLFNQ